MNTLVLLPGLDGTGLLLGEFAAACGPRVEVLPLAYPADRPLDYPELEALIRARLPRDRPFFLLAESFSGPLGIRLGAAPPPGLQGLILCCTFAHQPLPACLGPLLPPLPHSLLPLGLLGLLVLGAFATPALQAQLAAALRQVSPAVLRHRARAALAVDVRDCLPRIRMPVLCLQADADRLIPSRVSRWVAEQIPGAQRVDFHAPHFLLQVLPGPCAARVQDFMARAADHDVGNS